MRNLTRRRWPLQAALTLVLLGSGAACSLLENRAEAAPAEVQLEPVSTTGTNPFSPAVGTDQLNVTPPPQTGGTFPGDTVGLFGGTQKESSCDPGQLVAFLDAHPDKGAAFASVLGIQQTEIAAFVATLTPVILRSDTSVTNHGFVDGHVTAFAAVLQAGTAVLVDRHGFPVTKCFCGNPLTAPSAFTSVRFVGQSWPTFSATAITVIAPVITVINQFTLVQPTTGASFQRPAGTGGLVDGPVTQPPPGANPAGPSGSGTFGAAPPGATAAPPTAAPSPSVVPSPSRVPPPTGSPSGVSPSVSPSRAPGAVNPSISPSAAPSGPAGGAPAPGGSPSVSGAPGAASPTSRPSGPRASWVVGDCFVANGQAHAVVLVRNDNSSGGPQTYTVTVQLGPSGLVNVQQPVQVSASPGQIGKATVTAAVAGAPDTGIPCSILSIKDSNGVTPVQAGTLPLPPDTRPIPGPPTNPVPSANVPSPGQPAPATSMPRTTGPRTGAPGGTGVPPTGAPSNVPIPGVS